MSELKASEKWIVAGYELFAKEGPVGIQVERLARILNLNKSGFYHYFGDMENFSRQLIRYHYRLFGQFLDEYADCQNVDPEYLNIVVKHKISVMGQMQMVRNKSNPLFYNVNKELDEQVVRIGQRIWAKHLDIHNNPDLVSMYLGLVRDMFYSRITLERFTFDYLQTLAQEAKEIVTKIHNQRKNEYGLVDRENSPMPYDREEDLG